MWRRVVLLWMMVLFAGGMIVSCAERPQPWPRDLYEERYQEQQLQKVIMQQSG